MDCIRCNAHNPDEDRYCGRCGSILGSKLAQVKATMEAVLDQKVQSIVEARLKDKEVVTYEITEVVVKRLMDWAKVLVALVGIPLALILAKEYWDMQRDFRKAQQQMDSLEQRAGRLQEKLPAWEALGSRVEELGRRQEQTDEQVSQLEVIAGRNTAFQPLPKPTGSYPYHLNLRSVLSAGAYNSIVSSGTLQFQVTGDTGGIQDAEPQMSVAAAMAAQLGAAKPSPSFLYLLGNLINFQGEAANYYEQFYKPYATYAAPIFAIPGSHDGEVPLGNPAPYKSLAAFVDNFCSPSPTHRPEAHNLARMAMTQPNVYWTLEAPLATIIGIYTNVPEDGKVDEDQAKWLVEELKSAPRDKALILAMHHPAWSADVSHSGSVPMSDLLERVVKEAGRVPDIIFAAHVNAYERITVALGNRRIPFVTAGNGGYPNLRHIELAAGTKASDYDATLQAADDQHHGFVRVTVTKTTLTGEYFALDPAETSEPQVRLADSFTINLQKP